MELKKFITTAIKDIITALQDVEKDMNREVLVQDTNNSKSVEFEVAVVAEQSAKGTMGITVLGLIEVEGVGATYKNSSISKIKFGVYISPKNKDVQRESREEQERNRNKYYGPY